jgi:hypothetical protein
MNRVYLRSEPIHDELAFIGTNLFMTKSVVEFDPMNPKTTRNRFFCLSCRNRCPGYCLPSFATIEGSDEISGDQDRKKIMSGRLVFNVRSYRSGLILNPRLMLKGFR